MLNLIAQGGVLSTVATVVVVLAMFLLPALVVWLNKKIKFLNTIGAIAVCYLSGFIISVLPLGYDKALTQNIASILVALAIPLILFTIDLGSVKKLAKKTVLSFALVIVATVVVSTVAFFIANGAGLNNASQLAGMATGLYIGGTPNLIAIGNALIPSDVRSEVIAAANTSDFFVGGIYFLLILTVIRPVYRRFLDRPLKGKKGVEEQQDEKPVADEVGASTDDLSEEDSSVQQNVQAEYDYKSIPRDSKSIWRLIGVIGMAVGCLAVGAGLELLINNSLNGSLYILITVSVLGVAFSFIRPVRETKGAYQVGQYLILIFSLGLSMSIDLSALVREILPTLLFFACVQTSCVILHLILCKIFRIDSGTAVITSTAGIYGPPFIAPVANAFGDRKLIAPGVICGALGLALGNFIGGALGTVLGLF